MKNFKYLFLASAFTFFFSCSTDENSNESSLEAENIEITTTTTYTDSESDQASKNTLHYGDMVYQNNSDGSVTKTEPGKITYTITNENLNSSSVEILRERGSNKIKEYVITNSATKEFIKIYNIRDHKGFQTFDMVNDLGITAENVVSNGVLQQLEQRCPPCVIVIIAAAVELLSDDPLEQCANAMPSDCPAGQSPFMNFDEGGWFSGATCEVGCN